MDKSKNVEDPVSMRNNNNKCSEEHRATDGGLRAWVIVVASFLTNGIIFGIHNCYGLIYLQLKNQLEDLGIDDAPTKACESTTTSLISNRIDYSTFKSCLLLISTIEY